MTNSMILMIGISLFVLTFLLFLLIRRSSEGNGYEVFEISDRKLTVYSGIPVNYDPEDIESVVFSIGDRKGNAVGSFYIRKKDGSRSRPFFFDSSFLHKKTVFYSTRKEIETAIEKLTEQLREYGISSYRTR